MAERKRLLLRLDPAIYDAIARWAADDLRSINAQIEYALRRALHAAGRLPRSGMQGPPLNAPSEEGSLLNAPTEEGSLLDAPSEEGSLPNASGEEGPRPIPKGEEGPAADPSG